MTTPAQPQLVELLGWQAGMINRVSESSTPKEGLRAADNVDILPTGKIRRRDGYTLVDNGSWHSLWSDEEESVAFGVKDGALVVLGLDGPLSTLATGIAGEVSYTRLGDRVYWTDGVISGMVVDGGENRPWATPPLAHPPNMQVVSTGSLAAGDYHIAFTYLDGYGRESAATTPVVLTVAENQGISLSSFPTPPNGVVAINIYLTDPDGELLYQANVNPISSATSSYLVGLHARRRPLETQWLKAMPAGQLVSSANGRLFVAAHDQLLWSEPLRAALYNPLNNYMPFKGAIDMLVAVGQGEQSTGLYVAAEGRVYFLSGQDPSNWQRRVVLGTGVVRGTGIRVRAELFNDSKANLLGYAAFFVSKNGARYLGLASGELVPVSPNYVTPIADTGRSYVRRSAGLDQVITVLRGLGVNSLAVSDSAVAEVYRNGVQTSS